jgi:mRNA interferase MazF
MGLSERAGKEEVAKGDIVAIPFPFSDLSGSKLRPALVLSSLRGDDVILCQITSKNRFDEYSVQLAEPDLCSTNLRESSTIRPNRIFTADKAIISYRLGQLSEHKIKEVERKLMQILIEL